MTTKMESLQDEQGFVLVVALLVMVVLTILGIAATTNTSIELQIAGNDKVHQATFYESEAGAMLGSELLEQNFGCPGGFSNSGIAGPVWARILTMASNPTIVPDTMVVNLADPAYPAANYDAAYSLTGVALTAGVLPAQDFGYLYFGSTTKVLPGGALQMAAGYEGKGKAAAQGGAEILSDIYSQFKGLTNSESIVRIQWRHMIGSEGSCSY